MLAEPAHPETLWVVTYLKIRRWRDILPFLLLSRQVQVQAVQTPGAHGVKLRADLPHRRFWTLSGYRDRTVMNAFTQGEPHATAMKRFGDWCTEASFVEWSSASNAVHWEEALQRLKSPTYTYGAEGH